MNANEKPHIPFGEVQRITTDALRQVLEEHYQPDPRTISIVDKGNGVKLPYVGHAEITRILCSIDPLWSWAPAAYRDGRPAIHIHTGTIRTKEGGTRETQIASLWGTLTIHGHSRVCVGSVEANKPELDKELASDLIRNGAMRYGIALGLWAKDDPTQVSPLHPAGAPESHAQPSSAPSGPRMASDGAKRFLRTLAHERGYDLPDLNAMTAKDAYDLTEKLKGLPRVDDPAPDQEEPF